MDEVGIHFPFAAIATITTTTITITIAVAVFADESQLLQLLYQIDLGKHSLYQISTIQAVFAVGSKYRLLGFVYAHLIHIVVEVAHSSDIVFHFLYQDRQFIVVLMHAMMIYIKRNISDTLIAINNGTLLIADAIIIIITAATLIVWLGWREIRG